MKTRFAVLAVLLMSFFVSGCMPSFRYVTKSEPEIQKTEKETYSVNISPDIEHGLCRSFTLKIENKSKKDIQVDWNKTLYVYNGETRGGFMYEGIIYSERNNQRTPDFVLAESSFQKKIWPNILVTRPVSSYIGWGHEAMTFGEHGVFLTMTIDGQEIHEKMAVKLKVETVPIQ